VTLSRALVVLDSATPAFFRSLRPSLFVCSVSWNLITLHFGQIGRQHESQSFVTPVAGLLTKKSKMFPFAVSGASRTCSVLQPKASTKMPSLKRSFMGGSSLGLSFFATASPSCGISRSSVTISGNADFRSWDPDQVANFIKNLAPEPEEGDWRSSHQVI